MAYKKLIITIIWYHYFTLFIANFFNYIFSYFASIPKIDIIKFKTKDSNSTFLFILFIVN